MNLSRLIKNKNPLKCIFNRDSTLHTLLNVRQSSTPQQSREQLKNIALQIQRNERFFPGIVPPKANSIQSHRRAEQHRNKIQFQNKAQRSEPTEYLYCDFQCVCVVVYCM